MLKTQAVRRRGCRVCPYVRVDCKTRGKVCSGRTPNGRRRGRGVGRRHPRKAESRQTSRTVQGSPLAMPALPEMTEEILKQEVRMRKRKRLRANKPRAQSQLLATSTRLIAVFERPASAPRLSVPSPRPTLKTTGRQRPASRSRLLKQLKPDGPVTGHGQTYHRRGEPVTTKHLRCKDRDQHWMAPGVNDGV